jgi:uncharacterized cofD-like protein
MSPRGISTPVAVHAGPAVVALGGGHGLAASLEALRRVTDRITAVVTVADDGGSSGRLREEFGVIPPGDLRMALAALCGDDTWGRTWERVIQHRFTSEGPLNGHAVGNLLITALWQTTSGPVEGLDWVAALLEAQGRVLPSTATPLEIVAHIREHDAGRPEDLVRVVGQVAVAGTPGRVERIEVVPADAQACPESRAAVLAADAVILGPGSWFTSVMPHLLIDDLREAIVEANATKILVLNLNPQAGETSDFSAHAHLEDLHARFPGIRLDWVVADPSHVENRESLQVTAAALGARVHLAEVARGRWEPGQHDPQRLAVAFDSVLGLRRSPGESEDVRFPWR